ncbi:ABC transporter permease [Paraburkholderia sediminicola]|uniref:ABC transporter permease n=1 Tax=Paraburkholderia sediminicola TaxID=458836 RepID=UPI0038B88F5C
MSSMDALTSNDALADQTNAQVSTNVRLTFAERMTELRYRVLPDRAVGEIMSKKWFDNFVPFVLMILTLSLFSVIDGSFLTAGNLLGSARQLGEVSLITIGLMIVLAGGGIDLSIGSNFALGNVLAMLVPNVFGFNFWETLGVVLLCCGTIGAINGVMIGYMKLRAFLATLAMLIIVRAIVDTILLGYSSQLALGIPLEPVWMFVGTGDVFGLPASLLLLLLIGIGVHIILSRMRAGWHLMSVGGSRRSANNVGINVRRTVCGSYIVCGLLCGLSGALYAARLSSAGSDTGVGLEITVLTAAILGGNSIGGGRGSVVKALVGTITVLTISNGVIRLGLLSGAGPAVLGIVLLVAVAIDVRWLKNLQRILAKVYVSPTFVALPEVPVTEEGSNSPFSVNSRLDAVELIGLGELEGPEDVIFDRAGNLYTGERHGDIIRYFSPDYTRREVFAHIGGYPLGMAFDKDDNLYSCVGGMGLYRVKQDGTVELATDQTNRSPFSIIDDSRMRLADDLDIAPDGKVYFSEATIRYEQHAWPVDALESRGNGRIVCYDPATGRTRTVLRNLVFPNGVCLAHDGMSIHFAESWGARVNRYWLEGPKKGTLERLLPNLPGYPDNINRASDGTYWCAIMGMRTPALDISLRTPSFRKRMARRIPHDEWLYPNINTGCVIKYNDAGEILDAMWDKRGQNHPMITSMREHKGYLYLGGITNNRIGRLKLDGADPEWSGVESYWGKRA